MDKKIEIYCCYAHEDYEYLQTLKKHLSLFLQKNSILFWDDTNISAGTLWQDEIKHHMETASIVLLLVSADFLSSDYYNSKEMMQTMQRHAEGKVRVIPIILRSVAWQEAPFGKFKALPTESKPVSLWKDIDQAFLDVVQGIAKIARECLKGLHPDGVEGETEGFLKHGASEQLAQIIQGFKSLRGQIADYISLRGAKGFTLASCESEYTKLYRDTMVFLTLYLPERISNDAEGFVTLVQSRAAVELHQRSNFSVALARFVIPGLADFEKLAAQIDACAATLELYQQKYFSGFRG